MAEQRVRQALDHAGLHDVEVRHECVGSEQHAMAVAFRGSPTVLVNGRDPFGDGGAVGLACRRYATEHGVDGAPSVTQLAAAFASGTVAR